MAVRCHAIGLEAFVDAAIQAACLQAAACTRRAAFSINDDALGFYKLIFEQRHHSQNAACRIAARISDKACALDLVTEKLRQAIDSLRRRVLMLHVIPLFKNMVISKSVIAAKVNDFHIATSQLLANLHGMSMRQSNKNNVADSGNLLQLLHRFQLFVYASCQMRIHRCNRFTCTAFRGDSRDFCLRMSVQQSQQLDSGIACRANNTCFHIHPPLDI